MQKLLCLLERQVQELCAEIAERKETIGKPYYIFIFSLAFGYFFVFSRMELYY